MQVFSGEQFAASIEDQLQLAVEALRGREIRPKLAVLSFIDDPASRLYTRLKAESAWQAGIEHQVIEARLDQSPAELAELVDRLINAAPAVMIQKPRKRIWAEVTSGEETEFANWWQGLVAKIPPNQDADGLAPATLVAIKENRWREQGLALPATARAILSILDEAPFRFGMKVAIAGRSAIVGLPVYYELRNRGVEAEIFGRAALAERRQSSTQLQDFDVIISATGQPSLISGDMLKEGVIAIDVGEPKPDLDFSSVQAKASFITPVPGGVGPVTVVSLLQNVLDLIK